MLKGGNSRAINPTANKAREREENYNVRSSFCLLCLIGIPHMNEEALVLSPGDWEGGKGGFPLSVCFLMCK